MIKTYRKILMLGSGALKIGEAGEFDYSGSQAIKALREEHIQVILVNPNIATIQTSESLANRIYFLPVTQEFVSKVIVKERPDGIILGFGGQTALNCGLDLALSGTLTRYGVEVLGTSIASIRATEDRGLFMRELKKIGVLHSQGQAVYTLGQALRAARTIGYPVMVRNAFSLGGQNSNVAHNPRQLRTTVTKSLMTSKQILIEEYLEGWKEIEYEVMRDHAGNALTVCNMENMDPMGIHTGESIVVAPSQTLNNEQYHLLRTVAIQTIQHLGIIGECNIQFALHPRSNEYRIIEVNARLSRSSALASKATGYPLAFVSAKLGLGYTLPQLTNAVTKRTTACFEPALDYVAVKIPRWDLEKFRHVSMVIGSEMKSVGEVMALARSFDEALQKGLRMLNTGLDGLEPLNASRNKLPSLIRQPTPERVLAIASAFEKGISLSRVARWSKIDPWFLSQIHGIIALRKKLKRKKLNTPLLREAKQAGFSDKQIGRLTGKSERHIRRRRIKAAILPSIKHIDTLAAEYPAETNYLYATYHASCSEPVTNGKREILVVGSGPYSIGTSVEFDWCAVNAVITLRKLGYTALMINCNPETVSTDYDNCDALFFEEISVERILDIIQHRNIHGVILSMGGQIPNNLALELSRAGVPILGTRAQDIDRAENRKIFSDLLDRLMINQPAWRECRSSQQAREFAKKIGYPVLVRPSYVLSGTAMNVAFGPKELNDYLQKAARISPNQPVTVSAFISGAKEIEFDAVAQSGRLVKWIISEHVENAGVHSGDATIVLPAQKLSVQTNEQLVAAARKITSALHISGPFNIQFLAKDNAIKVIECNLRASRTFPFVSKFYRVNLIELATKAMLGVRIKPNNASEKIHHVGVKAPQFSFSRLAGADPLITVEMSSTGEVAALGQTVPEALLKALLATGFRLPKKHVLLSLGGIENKTSLLNSTYQLVGRGFEIYATPRTAEFLARNGIHAKRLHKMLTRKKPNVRQALESGKIELVVNTSDERFSRHIPNDYLLRRKTVDCAIPLITNAQLAELVISAICTYKLSDLTIKAWDEYSAKASEHRS